MEIDINPWKLRPWRPGDEDALVRHANNRRVWINLRDSFPHPYTREDAIAWVRAEKDRRPILNFTIASEVEAIGGIGIRLQDDVHARSGEIGYWLGEPFWGRGIGSRAVRAFTEYAFANFDVVRLYAIVFDWNPASARVLEKAGYVLEARMRRSATKDGKTIDEFLYALTRE